MTLIMMGLRFLLQEKDFSKIETKNNICINVYCFENKLVFPIYISDPEFENAIDLLPELIKTSHIMCISKIFTDLCFAKQIIKTKNNFARVVCSVLLVKMY